MREISVSEFKTRCLFLLEEIRKTRDTLRMTRHGVNIAKVVPPCSVRVRTAWIGSMKGSLEILGDIVSPSSEKGGL
jgi:antitoxin (DNA-binding transcriptional repressor) of toxin-antitoxin stability system